MAIVGVKPERSSSGNSDGTRSINASTGSGFAPRKRPPPLALLLLLLLHLQAAVAALTTARREPLLNPVRAKARHRLGSANI